VLAAHECATVVLNSPVCSAISSQMQRPLALSNITVNYVCRENVERK